MEMLGSASLPLRSSVMSPNNHATLQVVPVMCVVSHLRPPLSRDFPQEKKKKKKDFGYFPGPHPTGPSPFCGFLLILYLCNTMRPWRIMPLLLSFLGVLLLLRVTFHSQGDDQRPIRTQQELQQPRLFLFIFLASHENLALTRKLLRHYLTLGYQPELIHIDFHIQTEEEASAPHSLKLKGVLREHGVTAITERILGKFFDDVKMDWQRDSTRRMGVKRGDWVVQIDSDEFHEYPGPVMDLLVEAERHRVSAIVGHFVDRVESTGKLVEISEETDLERTFTQGCELATSIYEGLNKKVGPHLHSFFIFSFSFSFSLLLFSFFKYFWRRPCSAITDLCSKGSGPWFFRRPHASLTLFLFSSSYFCN